LLDLSQLARELGMAMAPLAHARGCGIGAGSRRTGVDARRTHVAQRTAEQSGG
jgi:hypothetical protein